jgi:hypothetical protein
MVLSPPAGDTSHLLAALDGYGDRSWDRMLLLG